MLKHMEKIISRILENIEHHEADSILIEDEELNLDIKNFLDIKKQTFKKKLVFIDGGNMEIIRSPSLSLFFIRVYATTYSDNRREKNNRCEFYTLITTKSDKNRIVYKTEYFFTKNNINLKEYEFDSMDRRLTTGNKRAPISLVGDIIRRFAELHVAKEIDEEAIVVLDGSLESNYPHENQIMESIMSPRIICGLSKTTDLITKSGKSAVAALRQYENDKAWIYCGGRINDKDVFFLRLNKKSEYIFRFEVNNMHSYDLMGLVSALAENSKDPIFYGYPYGLIEADMFGRVSIKEKESLLLQTKLKFGKNFQKIRPYMNSLNAHDLLDNI
ncbi:hypothetical protein JXC34_02270, partial [Candidatus Woesearchaeota archaeon]|nr:hypothetical protein [Candidatus Woesearchaeota archaeon]